MAHMDPEELADVTVAAARDNELEAEIADITGLTEATVRRRLRETNGHTLVRNCFARHWPDDDENDEDDEDGDDDFVWDPDADDLADITVAAARDNELEAEIADITGLTEATVRRRLRETNGHTLVRNCFARHWPDDDEDDEDDEDGELDLDADELGDLTVSHAWENDLEPDIATVTGLTEATVERRLDRANGNMLVRNCFAQRWPDSDEDDNEDVGWELGDVTVTAARERELEAEIADITGLTEATVERRLRETNGNTLVRNCFARHWPDDEEDEQDDSDEIDISELRQQIRELYRQTADARNRQARPYQADAVTALQESVEEDREFSILRLPTGSGKTFVANEVARWVIQAGQRVLWIAPNWELLLQASAAYSARFGLTGLARIGGGTAPFSSVLPEADKHARVLYTTIHTLSRRLGRRLLAPLRFGLVVIDECHWGINANMGRQFLETYQGKAPLVGLSATPRKVTVPRGREKAAVVYECNYADLDGKYLATPILIEPETGFEWRPTLRSTGDFTTDSLKELAFDEDRNEFIVETVTNGLANGSYSKVMVFACDIKHANLLAEFFGQHGVSTRAVHIDVTNRRNRNALISGFRRGEYSVIVNVSMLTHGIDIPDLDAIVLARPTTSEILCSQMIGRGARITDTKRYFHVVEFTDNVRNHHEKVFHARELLPGGAPPTQRARRPQPRCHQPPPEDPRFGELREPGAVQGFPFLIDQTFGVEIEFTPTKGSPKETGVTFGNKKWTGVAHKMIRVLTEHAGLPVDKEPHDYHSLVDYRKWRVEFDSSAGWEVVSPILVGAGGFQELHSVMGGLNRFLHASRDVKINYRCGLHVTLGTRFDDRGLDTFCSVVKRLEPGLFTIVSPSRLYQFKDGEYDLGEKNTYCVPLAESEIEDFTLEDFIHQDESRYHTVNLCKVLDEDQHVEVRMLGGTTEFLVVAAWTSLWMQILNRARFISPFEAGSREVFPGGNRRVAQRQRDNEDLFKLLDEVDIKLPPALQQALLRRRAALTGNWRRAVPARTDSWNWSNT